MRLGIVTSHPIQYQAPLFRALAQRIDLRVYFAHRATPENQKEAGFGSGFQWDTDLTGGFQNTFLRNVAKKPSITYFAGCDTPDVGKLLARDRIDVIVVYGWHFKSYLQTTLAAKFQGLPVLVRTDSYVHAQRSILKRAVKKFSYPLLLRCFDGFLASGKMSADFLQEFRIPSSRVFIAPYCIDTAFFTSRARDAWVDRSRIRAQYGAERNELVVLFVGKLIERKRLDVLLNALSLLQCGINLRLFVVGTGDLEQAIRSQAQSLNVQTKFFGFVNQSNLPAIYAASDLMVLPSEVETWGLVVNEAFACGLPAIVSDRIGCAPDMIVENLTGRVVPVGDSQALAHAIQSFSAIAERETVKDALARMTQRYSPESSADSIIEAAEIVLGRRRLSDE